MAKALFGHVGFHDPVMATEVAGLRAQIRDLESTVLRLRAENDRLSADAHTDPLLTVGALTERPLADDPRADAALTADSRVTEREPAFS